MQKVIYHRICHAKLDFERQQNAKNLDLKHPNKQQIEKVELTVKRKEVSRFKGQQKQGEENTINQVLPVAQRRQPPREYQAFVELRLKK